MLKHESGSIIDEAALHSKAVSVTFVPV